MTSNVGFLVHDVARLMRKVFDNRMSRIGLTRSQWWVLAYLQHHDGISQRHLATILDLSPVSLGASLRRLEVKGRVRRVRDQDDGRSKRVHIADPDGSLALQMQMSGEALMGEVVQDLSTEERDELFRMLGIVKARLIALDAGCNGSLAVAPSRRRPFARGDAVPSSPGSANRCRRDAERDPSR